MQIVSVNWQKQDDEFISGVMVWNNSKSNLEFMQIKSGDRLNWHVTGPRMCIGFIDSSGERIPCPDHARASIGARCKPCDTSDFYAPCVRCTGESCLATPKRWEVCRKTDYVVYLVVFGNVILKVGVSTESRQLTRWIEQGADFGLILERVHGGKVARQIEDRIGKLDGIGKQVRGQKKVEILFDLPDRTEAETLIRKFIESNDLFDKYSEYMIIPLSKYYNIPNIRRNPYSLLAIRNSSADLKLVGNVIGMKGSLLITDTSHSYQVVDLKGLVGYDLNTNEDVSVETQASLEEFF